jgi:hypothetical protein
MAAITAENAIGTSSQISGRAWPLDRGAAAVVVGAGTVVVGAGVVVLGAGALEVGAGALVVGVAVGVSGKRSVSVGGVCPVPVAGLAGDGETPAAASTRQTVTPVTQLTDGNSVQLAVIDRHTPQTNPPGDVHMRTHRGKNRNRFNAAMQAKLLQSRESDGHYADTGCRATSRAKCVNIDSQTR